MQSSGGSLPNIWKNIHQILHSPVSWGWVGMVVAVQMWVTLKGGPEYLGEWFEIFGLSRDGFLSGEIWQILSYGFLHGSWWHAGLNAMLVLGIGSRVEHVAGPWVMMRAMVAGVVAGGLAHLVLGSGLLVGLSGGCMALLLLLVTLSPQSRMYPLPVTGKNLGIGILTTALVFALLHPALGLPGFSMVGRMLEKHGMGGWFQIGHACHLGGGLAGWVYGRWILRPRVTLDSLRRDRARREVK